MPPIMTSKRCQEYGKTRSFSAPSSIGRSSPIPFPPIWTLPRRFRLLQQRWIGPKITDEIRVLIRRLAAENPDWGSPKIHGEFLKLGCVIHDVFETREDLLLFRARRGGPIRESRFEHDHFKPLLKSAGLPAFGCTTCAMLLRRFH